MKKGLYILTIVACLSLRAFAQGQPITLHVGDRLPNLYYWDTNWIDYIQLTYFGNNVGFIRMPPVPPELVENVITINQHYDCFYGRPCITEEPIKVIGLACFAYKAYFVNVVDTNRMPEYLYLYQVLNDSLYLLDSGNWDTATVNYTVELPMYNDYYGSNYNVYEVFFEKAHYVHDTFVVGGTTHNNLMHGWNNELSQNPIWSDYFHTYPSVYGFAEHAPNLIGVPPDEMSSSPRYPSNPPYCYMRFNRSYPFYYVPANIASMGFIGYYSQDTTILYKCDDSTNRNIWLPFFAILDTDFVNGPCMGMVTTGLYVEAVDTSGKATLAWVDSGVDKWQVSVAPLGVEADSGMLYATPINYVQVTGLDTGTWYVARVRTLCDADLFGAWSDTVLFYVPGRSCVTPTGLHVTAVDSAMVSLVWDAGMTLMWQVEVGMCDLGMSNAQTVTTTAPALTVADLPYGDAWYWARVRMKCDTDFWSTWSDTVRFHVPNHYMGGGPDDPNDTTQAINPVELYTYLMPNPARDEVTVASSFRVKAVELYAADGKLLQQVEVNAVGTTLSLEGLPAGIYFVRVRTSAGVTTKRLVVE